jgi:hypothetical protein
MFLRPGSILSLLGLLVGVGISSVFGQSVTCPDGFTAPPVNLYTGFCYRYITKTQTWNAHENECSQVMYNGLPYAGGHLATLFDANSARVVMNNYCNSLNQGQSYYFIGYYCISSSYTSRPDWRWTSGKPTTWIHSAPTYLSGAEPDDAGCGLAHYSDDGANPGRIGDWACSRALSGGCCEAPVVPTPSASTTGTQTATSTVTGTSTRTYTPTQTATSTISASSTQTPSQTGTVTMTRTGSKTSTETRTSSGTMTATSTATSTETPTSSASVSVSVSESASASSSVSPSASVSQSMTASVTATISPSISATATRIRVMVFPGQAGLAGGSQVLLDENGVITEEEAAAAEAAAVAKKNWAIIGGAVGGGVLLCCCLLGGLWFCLARRRQREKEKRARERMNRKSYVVASGKLKRTGPVTSVASTLGVKDGGAKGGAAMMSMFNSMNPALVKAKRGTMAPGLGVQRNPRMTMALASYKNTSAFKPTMILSDGGGRGLLQEKVEEVQTDSLVDDAVIGVEEDDVTGINEDDEEGVEETAEEANEDIVEVAQEEYEEAAEEDDYVDEEDAVAAAAAGRVGGRAVSSGSERRYKQKKTAETAAQPLEEPRKLVIGKGAVLKEQVQKQTVMLRRVSKVKGDKELTALRQDTVRFARPSMAGRGQYGPQSSNRNLLSTPYAFTATVSRVLIKENREDVGGGEVDGETT